MSNLLQVEVIYEAHASSSSLVGAAGGEKMSFADALSLLEQMEKVSEEDCVSLR